MKINSWASLPKGGGGVGFIEHVSLFVTLQRSNLYKSIQIEVDSVRHRIILFRLYGLSLLCNYMPTTFSLKCINIPTKRGAYKSTASMGRDKLPFFINTKPMKLFRC